MPLVSIVIPIGPDETQWKTLLSDLSFLNNLDLDMADTEIIIAAPFDSEPHHISDTNVHWLCEGKGRAEQLNAGARHARGEFMWFLHADSRVDVSQFFVLLGCLRSKPNCLYYFDLIFSKEGGVLMFLNEWGANIRSHLFGVPFGDQGFCIKKSLFTTLGGFPEDVTYGEDHLFVWKAKQYDIPIKSVGVSLYTSSRKYKKLGWFKTTCLHQYLWLKQACSEWVRLRKGKMQ